MPITEYGIHGVMQSHFVSPKERDAQNSYGIIAQKDVPNNLSSQRKYMKRSKLMQYMEGVTQGNSPFKGAKNLDNYTSLMNSQLGPEGKLKQIRGGYVITAAGRQIGIDRHLLWEDLTFNFDNDYLTVVPVKAARKLMTADVPHSNDSPSSSFINYTNRLRRDHTKMQNDHISEASTLHNHE